MGFWQRLMDSVKGCEYRYLYKTPMHSEWRCGHKRIREASGDLPKFSCLMVCHNDYCPLAEEI